MPRLRILNVVGARPNFMKVAPLWEEMRAYEGIEPLIVHTGQHYDHKMSTLFFDHLGLPKPDVYLGVGSGGHGEQTGRIMIAFERTVRELSPDLVVVVGDVNSTIACGLVAVKLGVRLAHVEAGLRSFDRTMPEEVNRVLTDQISDYLFTTERLAHENLRREGIAEERVFFVGNVMIDSLLKHREKAAASPVLSDLGLDPKGYVLVTLHRPANVDDPQVLAGLVEVLGALSVRLPVVFPIHPRTRAKLAEFRLERALRAYPELRLIEPLGYLDFLKCTDNARLVLTDSGGIQEETTVLGVPCITARDNTERPVTVTEGTNVLVGRDPERLLEEANRVLDGHVKTGRRPELWDGKAARRIVKTLWDREGSARLGRPGPEGGRRYRTGT
jgi:UDP-N-acetylglucosamine 2-epimerase (non-hydrolysing)